MSTVYSKAYTERDGSEFQDYPEQGFAVEFRAASHRYHIHQDGERSAAISVTSALKVLDKPALIGWAERCGVEGALRLERAGQLHDVAVEQACEIVRINGMGADAKREEGADRGTAVHEALRLFCSEGRVPDVGDFPAEVRGYVSAACAWLLSAQPQATLTETVIGSPEHRYAGRVDLIAHVDGRLLLIDLKTNPNGRVFDEAHLQTAAYLGALPECGIADVEGAVIVALGAEGRFEQVACEAEHSDFLSVLGTHRCMARVRSARQARERAAKAAAK